MGEKVIGKVGYENQGSGYDSGAVGYELQGRDIAEKITIVMPYYNNPRMLSLQYAFWAAWPNKLRDRLRVIIVDDGSVEEPAISVPRSNDVDVEIYQVIEDRPWHQHAARNLGAKVAQDGWMLITDMDHVLLPSEALSLFKMIDKRRADSYTIYMLGRVEADTGLPTLSDKGVPKPHPNSFFLTRSLYWKIGGYDEDYCGLYGTDRLFRERAFAVGKKGHLDVPLVRFHRGIIDDASTRTLPRKEGRQANAKQKIALQKIARGEGSVIKTLQFEWERVV